jgi:S1-C subfamily serine protease
MGVWKKPILLCALALTVCSATMAAVQVADSLDLFVSCEQAAIEMAQPTTMVGSVVALDCTGASPEGLSQASAARVDQTRWITATHALEAQDGARFWLVDYRGHAFEITDHREDRDLDISILKVPGAAGRVYRIAPASPGQAVVAHATDSRWVRLTVKSIVREPVPSTHVTISNGVETREPKRTMRVEYLRGDIHPGFSGGPIIDRRGRMVAMGYAHREDALLSLAISAADLRRFIGSEYP